jgi:uncharacterized protein (TIGR02391 family)
VKRESGGLELGGDLPQLGGGLSPPASGKLERLTAVDEREQMNTILAFSGMQLAEDGHLRKTDPIKTLTEAQRRAKSLYQRLAQRGAHSLVLKYCTAELLADNYFHAVLEASKGLFARLRDRTGLDTDGAELIDQALGIPKGSGTPRVAFNSLRTESERSEQRGLANLFKGVAGTFRNPTAHAPRISWSMSEQDALDLLSLVSMLHRRLDQAIDVPPTAAAVACARHRAARSPQPPEESPPFGKPLARSNEDVHLREV